jgi:DNA-binding winged helix-turn-helix (wHTH) protein
VEIGTRLLGGTEPEQAADESGAYPASSPTQGEDGTLLAVVPIPGTGTSLAIVGYPVSAPGAASVASPAPEGARDRSGLLLDHDQRRVWVDGREVALTFQEFELLAFLSAHPATVFSRADLVRRVWQRDFSADSRTVDVHVSRLRHKLGPAYGRYLVTEYRVGYQFRAPVALLPADVGACLGDGDAQQHPLLRLHRRPVFVPVGMLARDPAVVVH